MGTTNAGTCPVCSAVNVMQIGQYSNESIAPGAQIVKLSCGHEAIANSGGWATLVTVDAAAPSADQTDFGTATAGDSIPQSSINELANDL